MRNRLSYGFGWLMTALSLVPLSGCDSGAPKNAFTEQASRKYTQTTALEGQVSNDQGPVKDGTIKAMDEQGKVIAETALLGGDRYRLEIPGGTALPIVLTYHPAGEGEQLITAVVHPTVTQFDITPLSTAIAKKAKALGGYTHGNLLVAAESMGTVPDANKTTAGFRGDPTTQYGGWH